MTDLITPIIFLTFGGVMAVAAFGFYILMHRNKPSQFRPDDYSNYGQFRTSKKYYPKDFFRRESTRLRRENVNKRAVLFISLLLILLVSVAIADIFFDTLDLLLFLILLSPFLFRLLRSQRRESDEEKQDHDHRSSS
jgi:Flp pilus assembly protein TadB